LGFIVPVLFCLKARKERNVVTSQTEFNVIGAIVFFVMLLFFLGIADSLLEIQHRWGTYGSPFECHGV